MQQASILGNLEKFGVLKKSCLTSNATSEQYDSKRALERDTDVSAVVEFGAGRGYLTQMLADCYGIKKVLLVERKSYKLKVSLSKPFLCIPFFKQTFGFFYLVLCSGNHEFSCDDGFALQ